jgi:hypothetical protein
MAYVVCYEACKTETYLRMLTCEGTGTEKVSTGTWTGFPLMHVTAFAVCIESLGQLSKSLSHSLLLIII